MIREFIKQMNFAVKAQKSNNKSAFTQYADIMWCMLRYGASPNNYLEFEFDKVSLE